MRFRATALVLASLAGALLFRPDCLTAGQPDLEGQWEGAVVFAPAEVEIDFRMAVAKGSEGAWTGTIAIPILGVESAPVQNLKVNGSEVSFDYRDAKVSRSFKGTLDGAGNAIQGTSRSESDEAPFALQRVSTPPPARPALTVLSANGQELVDLFNREQDKTRLLVILAPNCERCRVGARLAQRYALDKIKDDRLRVYLLWQPLHKGDSRESAEQATALLPDPRVKHFWIENSSLSDRFKEPLGLKDVQDSKVWDVYLAFAPGLRWEERPPAPTWFQHLLPEMLPKERIMNGFRLHDELTVLLEKSPQAGAPSPGPR